MSSIREARLESGLTQRQVAEMLGVPEATYRSWERRERAAPTDLLPALREGRAVERRGRSAPSVKVCMALSAEAAEVWSSWPSGLRSEFASRALLAFGASQI